MPLLVTTASRCGPNLLNLSCTLAFGTLDFEISLPGQCHCTGGDSPSDVLSSSRDPELFSSQVGMRPSIGTIFDALQNLHLGVDLLGNPAIHRRNFQD
jgi:hypothetical protein